MEDKLEQLLNSLLKKGWKPFGEDIKQIVKNRLFLGYVSKTPVPLSTLECKFSWVLRELASKESGLRQFVVDNEMVRKDSFTRMITPEPFGEDQYNYKDYEYRLIESALKDEAELEQFLLDNIKV